MGQLATGSLHCRTPTLCELDPALRHQTASHRGYSEFNASINFDSRPSVSGLSFQTLRCYYLQIAGAKQSVCELSVSTTRSQVATTSVRVERSYSDTPSSYIPASHADFGTSVTRQSPISLSSVAAGSLTCLHATESSNCDRCLC